MLDEQAAKALQASMDARINGLRELAALRAQSRKATRERLSRRRNHGLKQRHATKLARIERTGQ